MTAAQAPRVPVVPLGGTAGAALVWRDRDQLRVTVIVKASFAFAHEAPMRQVEPAPIHAAEVHHGENPARSIAAPADLAPYLPRADVLLVATAHAPKAAPAPAVAVRLLVAREAILLSKTLHVVGDRDGGGDPAPFARMPILYEKAFGGAGHRQNPLGVGAGSDRRRPNVVDPAAPDRLAGFAPIARTWPARKTLLAAEQRKALELPIPEILDGFDWTYFQSAPPDQRIDYLHGDEWIALDGMHPALPRLSSRLPGAHAAARVYGYGPAPEEGLPLHLEADTLLIDADAERCSLTFRGSFAIHGEDALARVRIVAGIELPGAPLPWLSMPLSRGVHDGGDASEPPTAEPPTVTIDDDAPQARPSALDRTQLLADAGPAGASHDGSRDARAQRPGAHRSTAGATDIEAAMRQVLPFEHADAPHAPASHAPLPAPLPGAPWSPGAVAAPVPRVTPSLETTIDLTSFVRETADPPVVEAPVGEPRIAERPIPQAAAHAPVAAAPAASPEDPWRPNAPEAPEAPAPARPAPPKPRPSVKGDIYKKFKR